MKTKKKVAVIYSRTESSWISCQTIVPNLLKAYRLVPDIELVEFNYSPRISKAELELMLFSVLDAKPDVIAFIDHKPHPVALLMPLLKVEDDIHRKYIFHIYGDFSLYLKEWKETFDLLKGRDVLFVSASERQMKSVSVYMEDSSSSKVCPFPINGTVFNFSNELREKMRREWGASKDELIYVYVGRISQQKRIRLLLRAYAEAAKATPEIKSRLLIYGLCDSVGEPFLQRWEIPNEYFRKLDRTFESLPEEVKPRISFMGHLPNEQLPSVYSGADCLVSLSVHNDEDFGMCVAEAQFCGLPAIITDWAGYAGFELKELPEAVKYVPVKLGLRNKNVSKSAVISHLIEMKAGSDLEFRKTLMSLARSRFSVESVSQIIHSLIYGDRFDFKGGSATIDEVIATIKHHVPELGTPLKTISPLYKKVYSAYVRQA